MIFTTGALRVALGLAFVLFFPGYTLIAALFPRKGGLGGIERVALSFGLSIAVVPLMGLALNYTPWGIRLYPILASALFFIVMMSAIAWFRRRRLPPGERFQVWLRPSLLSLFGSWVLQSRWDRLLTVLLMIAIAGAIGTLVYVIAQPKAGERFTEFYILGLEGKAEDYPRETVLGEESRVILGIVNQEHEVIDYKMEITIDGEMVGAVGPITLEQEETWEHEVAFVSTRTGPNQKVEFLLYKGESSQPYLTLHLLIDVKEAP